MMQNYLQNKVFLDNDGLLQVWVVGPQDEQSVAEMGELIRKAAAQLRAAKKPVIIFDDLTKMGPTSAEARKTVADLAKTLDFDKVAMVGGSSSMLAFGTNLMLRAIGKSSVRYFSDAAMAKAWLLTK